MSVIVGYARVSTDKQKDSLELQIESLRSAGASKVFSEIASGADRERPELGKVLALLEPGDTLLVASADRFSRDLDQLFDEVRELINRGVGFSSLAEPFLDFTDPDMGKLILFFRGWVASQELKAIRRRTRDALQARRDAGEHLGRLPLTESPERMRLVRKAFRLRSKGLSTREISLLLSVSKPTVARWLADGRFVNLAQKYPAPQTT